MTKKEILLACEKKLKSSLSQLDHELLLINEAIANETKNTAGDKHEVAKAQYQRQQEQLLSQLNVFELQLARLVKIRDEPHERIGFGTLFKTNQDWFFLAVPIGKIKLQDKIVITLSKDAPIALKFIGKQVGDLVEFNQSKYIIKEIL